MLIGIIPKDIYAQRCVTFTSSVLPLFSAACKLPPPYFNFNISFYFVDQPTFILIFPLLPLPLLCAHAAAYYHSFPYFFFSTPQCIHRTGTVSHMARYSLFFTAAQSSWKAGDETWQVNQPNRVESVKHLDASRLTDSTFLRVAHTFCPLKQCFVCHTLKLLNIWCIRMQCRIAFTTVKTQHVSFCKQMDQLKLCYCQVCGKSSQ